MIPRDTLYQLATAPADYRKCRALLREQDGAKPLSWPTVMALRDGQVIGFLATNPLKEAVIAGPLVVSKEIARPGIIVMRLVEAYDLVMQRAGIRAYHFHIDAHNKEWRRIVEKLGLQPYKETETGVWFRRSL